MKLGSLFDGSGGFPLAAVINGIEPVWASEIEPFPIRVTKLRFPKMKHLGSVTDINGAEIEPVDIITFGSPCQDLSVAGKQAGIHDGERSSLFFEAIRIIKEMRDHDRATGRADHDVRPHFAVWENVPGAFSSNKGADFQAVLQALCEIEGSDITVPMPPKGKWKPAGCIVGDGWSVAWRVYDAQFWGVPQRRKRIYLIADFASERAGEILFEPESMPGDSEQGGKARESTAEDAEGSLGGSGGVVYESKSLLEENWAERTVKNALRAEPSKSASCVVEKVASFMGGQGAKARSIAYCDDGITPTLRSAPSGSNTVPDVCYAIEGHIVDRQTGQNGRGWAEGYAHTPNATDLHAVAYGLSRSFYCGGANGGGIPIGENFQPGMTANGCGAVCVVYPGVGITSKENASNPSPGDPATCLPTGNRNYLVKCGKPPRKYIVRRLTPIECARLQGFPDWWCDGADGSDSAQYKLWGNGISLPCAVDVLGRIAKEANRCD